MVEHKQPKWNLPDPILVDEQLAKLFPNFPVFTEILQRRGINTPNKARAFLYPDEYPQSDPFDFPGMLEAVELVNKTIEKDEKIGICGDFDTDGLTATAILYEGLMKLTPHVYYQVPVRGKETHGISEEIIKTFNNLGVTLLITCDTGVSEVASIEYAKSLGMKVIITDHHTFPPIPANANITINPEMLPEAHPMHHLSGSAVAYKLIEAVFRSLANDSNFTQFLDLAAIGIIGDLVPLTGENRFLAQLGIDALQKTEKPGLTAIFKNADVVLSRINEKTISHVIAPRLNSLSRMFDGNIAIELLITRDASRAKALAQLAEEANTKRRQMMDTISMAAQSSIENDRTLLDKPLIFLENDEWHHSVLGLVASQLADRFARPVIIVSSYSETMARGSARSVNGIDITALISEHANLLGQYGGHAMAAGFSIKKENLVDLKRALMSSMSHLTDKFLLEEQRIDLDAILPLWEPAKNGFLEGFQLFRPFGPENPVINFLAEDLTLLDAVYFGKDMQHIRLNVSTRKLGKHSIIWWNGTGQPLPPEQFDLVYQVGNPKPSSPSEIQINLIAFRPHENLSTALRSSMPAIEIIDWREKSITDQPVLQQASQPDTITFAEGIQCVAELPAKNRFEITSCTNLILLTCPASYDILKELVNIASPKRVYIMGITTDLDHKNQLMKALTEYILESFRTQDGKILFRELAAKTGQTERSIRLAIDWLVNKTTLHIKEKTQTEIILDRLGSPTPDIPHLLEELEKSFEETAAFKRFFRKTNIHDLFLNLETDTNNIQVKDRKKSSPVK